MRLDIQLFADGKVVIETKLDTKGFEEGLDDMEHSSMLSQFIVAIQDKLSKIGKSISTAIKKAGSGIKGIGKAVASVGSIIIKTMGKAILSAIGFGVALTTALGVIGLLALAFLAIIEAAKKVGEENKQLKTDIQYILFAIKTALQPVIDWIANAIVKIIQLLIQAFKIIAMIINAIAGKNVFAGATADAFAKSMKKAEKSSKGVAKSAKETKKQLSGFDEMNILSDTSASGGAGGVSTPTIKPSFDFSNLDFEKPEWIKKIEEHFDKIRVAWKTTKGILKDDWDALKKIFTDQWNKLKTEWQTFTGILSDKFNEAKNKIVGYFTNLKAQWESFKVGIHNTMIDLKDKIVQKWQEIKDKIASIPDNIKQRWNDFKDYINEKVIMPVVERFTNFKEKVIGIWASIKDKATEIFNNVKTFITDKIINPITDKFNSFKTTITDIFGKIKDALKGPLNTMIGWVNKLIDGINKVSIKVPAWVNKMIGNGNKETTFGFNIKKIPKLAKGGIINMPGRGVAVGGERGAEGVIPLTDNQQMELLGEAIGRYITINANITNSMNGRIISRELQKIQNENSFAGNR